MNKNQSAEKSFTQIAAINAQTPETASPPDKPVIMLKRIRGTTYQVTVHFSKTSTETINDKITRLIQNETENGKAVSQ